MATIGFSVKFPWGEETHFVPKIWKGLVDYNGYTIADIFLYAVAIEEKGLIDKLFPHNLENLENIFPKIHTIREDKANLWKPGRKIHPVVFNQTKDRFQFAPVLECKSVQKIEIRYIPEMPGRGCIKINGIFKSVFNSNFSDDKDFLNQLALNDGFNSIEDFFRFFNKDFTGKIIHFTDFEY